MDRTGGVLTFNNEIRNVHLQTNLGKYSQYTDPLNPAIGEYYQIYTRPLVSITNGKPLMDYTHDGTTQYSQKINHDYLNDDLPGHHIYSNDKPVFTNFWTGDFRNYLDYVTAVYAHETVPIQFVNGILSLNFMDKALELIQPGIVRDIAPAASLAGAVKTNINNFSGTDTRLGLITNQMYAKSLLIGATFNSDRQRTSSYKDSLITPSLLTKYGNTETNVNALPNLILPNHSDGHVVEDYNADVYIFDEYGEIANLNNVRIAEALKKNVDQPFVKWNGSSYHDVTTNTYYNSLDPSKKDTYVDYHDEIIKTTRGKYVNMHDIVTTEYQDSDRRENGQMVHIMYEDKDLGVVNPSTKPEFDSYRQIRDGLDRESLLSKTNQIFKEYKIHTIYGEHPVDIPFGMGNFVDTRDKKTSTTDTSKSSKGRSRGRNLLKKNPDGDGRNNYNPFCRVWTYHNQYDRVNKLIRPFTDKESDAAMSLSDVQAMNVNYRSFIKQGTITNKELDIDGGEYLARNTVLRKTGYVNITPSSTEPEKSKVDISKCMFSIENLAWKDVPDRVENLSKEQRGPHGGRIMWFPPYDINFNENINANWESNTFIGRGEKVYTYTNTDRTGTLSFTLLIDHPAILNDLHNEAGQDNLPDYDGNGEDDKMENDILRFFAGCMPLKYIRKVEKPKEKPEIPGTDPEPKYKTIRIYVFYPNNYSGHAFLNGGVPTKFNFDDKTLKPDDDFARYLVSGRNIIIPTTGEKYGYEILTDKEHGISVNEEAFKDEVIHACKFRAKAHRSCNVPYDLEDKDKKLFRYRVDYDLKQNYLKYDSYNDTASNSLNLDINAVKTVGKKENADYSFAEFYYVIEKLKKDKGKQYDEQGLNLIYRLIGEINPEMGEERLNELYQILSDTTEFETIKIRGGATTQDSGNSKMLADRRSGALKWYLNTSNIRSKSDIAVEDPELINVAQKDSINTVEAKSARYAVVELTYPVSDTQKLSETDANVTQKEETVEHAKAMKVLYDTMLKTSEILSRYTNSGIASEEDFVTWFDSDNNTQREYFSDKEIEEHYSEYIENNTEEFYQLIYNYCEYVYKEQNVITDTFGFSKNINLSDSIALDNINWDFRDKLGMVEMMSSKIEEMLEEIDNDDKNIKEKQTNVEQIKNKIEIKTEQIKNDSNLLDYLKEGTIEYLDMIDDIQTNIDEKNYLIREDLKNAERELKNAQKEKEKDEKTLNEYIKSNKKKEDKKRDKEIEKLEKDIKQLDEKIKKAEEKIIKKDTEIQAAEDKLQEYITKAAEHTMNQTTSINYWKNQVIKLSNDKKDLEKDKTELIEKRQEKENKRLDLIRGEKETFDNLPMPSVGNVMYLMEQILSKDEYYDFYEKIFITGSETFNKEFFADPKAVYSAVINNLISGFRDCEVKSPQGKKLAFWVMYAIYLLVKWIESDICGLGDKQTDDVNELFKCAADVVIEFDVRRFLMYLVGKYRITNEQISKFNIKGVTDIDDTMFDIEILESLEKTNEFIQADEPTQEMANAALKELNEILEKSAKQISQIANQRKKTIDAAENAEKTTISENNETGEQVVEDAAANTVLSISDLRENYRQNGHRYETESEYFSKLQDTDPVIFKYIKDKIKYFDPAFHSMSPEGFNARLTFLQQCTRQGHTIEDHTSGDATARTAGNLAFGRMPVCVLRIGDFIYSRIIINSISINYENNGGIQWDLNPEGAGVQPMMAKVSMAITILGGQSLEGPISRLQNAISFNYYANTGVYDNRSDRARPKPKNESSKSDGTTSQTVEGNEASVKTGENKSAKSTKDKYTTENYYVWSPVNEDGKSLWEEKKVENKD